MKVLDKKIKKRIYFTLILVGVELPLISILYIASNYMPSIPVGIVLGPFGILLWSFIINLVLSIYFLINGIKIKEKILIFLAPLYLIPILAWFIAMPFIFDNIPATNYDWKKLISYPTQQEQVTVIFED